MEATGWGSRVRHLARGAFLAFCGCYQVGGGEAVKSWISEADCHRGYCLASRIVTGESNLAACKLDETWLPGSFFAGKGPGLLGRLLQAVRRSPVFTCSLAWSVCVFSLSGS